MTDSWTKHCRHRDFEVSGNDIVVALGDRAHKVTVVESSDSYLLVSVVIKKKLVNGLDDLALSVWARNRDTALVGFRIDHKERLVAEAWLPKTGLTTEEFRLRVRTVAQESDRFEFQLTGADVE